MRIPKASCIGNATIANPTRFFIKVLDRISNHLKKPGSGFEGEIDTIEKGEHC